MPRNGEGFIEKFGLQLVQWYKEQEEYSCVIIYGDMENASEIGEKNSGQMCEARTK